MTLLGLYRRRRKPRRSDRGVALVEFAVVSPFLIMLTLGGMRFALAINNYIVLNQAVRAGSRTFALSRGKTNNRALASTRVSGAAPNLSGLTVHTYVNGTECTDPNCATALSTAYATNPRTAQAKVTAQLSCSIRVMNVIYPCAMAASMEERIE